LRGKAESFKKRAILNRVSVEPEVLSSRRKGENDERRSRGKGRTFSSLDELSGDGL